MISRERRIKRKGGHNMANIYACFRLTASLEKEIKSEKKREFLASLRNRVGERSRIMCGEIWKCERDAGIG